MSDPLRRQENRPASVRGSLTPSLSVSQADGAGGRFPAANAGEILSGCGNQSRRRTAPLSQLQAPDFCTRKTDVHAACVHSCCASSLRAARDPDVMCKNGSRATQD